MAGTKSTTSENEHNSLTPLAEGLKNDRDEDYRSCPHDCHGSLTLTEKFDTEQISVSRSTSPSVMNDKVVVCETCRCTPDGVYLPLDDVEYHDTYHSRQFKCGGEGGENTTLRVRNGMEIYTPDGPQGTISNKDGWKRDYDRGHETYDNSNHTRLAGGYEVVYDADEDVRPWGVDDSYTWDLSTL